MPSCICELHAMLTKKSKKIVVPKFVGKSAIPTFIYCELVPSNCILNVLAINGEAVTLKLKLALTPLTVYVIVYACI